MCVKNVEIGVQAPNTSNSKGRSVYRLLCSDELLLEGSAAWDHGRGAERFVMHLLGILCALGRSLPIDQRPRRTLFFRAIRGREVGMQCAMSNIGTVCFLGRGDHLCLQIVVILTRVGSPPVESIKKVVESCCKEGAQQRANPVDPVVAWEAVVHDIRTEGSRRVDTSTRVIDTCHFVSKAVSKLCV